MNERMDKVRILLWALRAVAVLLGIALVIVGINQRRDGLVISAAILIGATIVSAGNSGTKKPLILLACALAAAALVAVLGLGYIMLLLWDVRG